LTRFLGLDLSTQSLSATIIDVERGEVVHRSSVNYGADLPQYGAPSGFVPHPDARIRQADPCMWVEALDLLLHRATKSGVDWSAIAAISGGAQQHASVYLGSALQTADADPSRPLTSHLAPALSRPTAPIWLDSSTTRECREIADAVGGDEVVARETGSRTTERFTGPQIRRFARIAPDRYERTTNILLASSLGSSLMSGSIAPTDVADATGMNLLRLAHGAWSPELLAATAPELETRLGRPAPSGTVLGPISPYLAQRHGFNPKAAAVIWSGDNPCSLVGSGAIDPGTLVISLGTSDTCFSPMAQPRVDPNGYGHTFGHPAGGFFGITVFSNGALARAAVAERVELNWRQFEAAIVDGSEPANSGNMMIPYFTPEITPRVSSPRVVLEGDADFREWKSPAAAARAVVEAQAVAMRFASKWIVEQPHSILVTGGGSLNAGIRQVFADVFGAPVRRLPDADTVALGAAMRAAQALGAASWDDLTSQFAKPDARYEAVPAAGTAAVYEEFGRRYLDLRRSSFGIEPVESARDVVT
jgi:xylulokinase